MQKNPNKPHGAQNINISNQEIDPAPVTTTRLFRKSV